jgi:hypothetical protein
MEIHIKQRKQMQVHSRTSEFRVKKLSRLHVTTSVTFQSLILRILESTFPKKKTTEKKCNAYVLDKFITHVNYNH